MQATLDPGDEVIIHEPGWLSYQEQAKLVGATPTFIPYDCPIDDFHKHFSSRTKMLVINNPNNPAGRAYLRGELVSLYQQCRSRGIYILVDEAYSDFVIEEKFHSMVNVVPDKVGTIVVNSLSKNMGMSGWRVGYVVKRPRAHRPGFEIKSTPDHLRAHHFAILHGPILRRCNQDHPSASARDGEKRTRVGILMDELGLKRMPGGSTFYFLVSIENYPGALLISPWTF